MLLQCFFFFFFFNDTATTEIYTLSLHDALPILYEGEFDRGGAADRGRATAARRARRHGSCGNRGAGRAAAAGARHGGRARAPENPSGRAPPPPPDPTPTASAPARGGRRPPGLPP